MSCFEPEALGNLVEGLVGGLGATGEPLGTTPDAHRGLDKGL
jgi:hypothetical protein